MLISFSLLSLHFSLTLSLSSVFHDLQLQTRIKLKQRIILHARYNLQFELPRNELVIVAVFLFLIVVYSFVNNISRRKKKGITKH